MKLIRSILGITLLVAWFIGIGHLIRAHFWPSVILWLAFPVAAALLRRRGIARSFTLRGLEKMQGLLMFGAMTLSFAMFAVSEYWQEVPGFSGMIHSGQLFFIAAWFVIPAMTWQSASAAINAEHERLSRHDPNSPSLPVL